MQATKAENPVFGLMAEFDDPNVLLDVAQKTYAAGYRKLDAYTPFPVHGLAESIGHDNNTVGWICFFGGIIGALSGFGLQYYCNVVAYPINIGGRPLNTWPMFIPITFELMVLFAALSSVAGMILLNGLPQPYHPVFNVPEFQLASRDRFFICIESADKLFDAQKTRDFLKEFKPLSVVEVPA